MRLGAGGLPQAMPSGWCGGGDGQSRLDPDEVTVDEVERVLQISEGMIASAILSSSSACDRIGDLVDMVPTRSLMGDPRLLVARNDVAKC